MTFELYFHSEHYIDDGIYEVLFTIYVAKKRTVIFRGLLSVTVSSVSTNCTESLCHK